MLPPSQTQSIVFLSLLHIFLLHIPNPPRLPSSIIPYRKLSFPLIDFTLGPPYLPPACLYSNTVAQHAFLFFPNTSSFLPPSFTRLQQFSISPSRFEAHSHWAWVLRTFCRLLSVSRSFVQLPLSRPPSPVLCWCSHSAGLLFSTSSHLLCPLLHLPVIAPPLPSYLLSFALCCLAFFSHPLPVSSASPALHTELCSALLKTFHPSSPPSLSPLPSVKRITPQAVHDRGAGQVAKCTVFCLWKILSLPRKNILTLSLHIRPYTFLPALASHTHKSARSTNSAVCNPFVFCHCLRLSLILSHSVNLSSTCQRARLVRIICPITIITTAPPPCLPCCFLCHYTTFVSFFRSKLCPPSFRERLPIYPWAKSFSTNCSDWAANGDTG